MSVQERRVTFSARSVFVSATRGQPVAASAAVVLLISPECSRVRAAVSRVKLAALVEPRPEVALIAPSKLLAAFSVVVLSSSCMLLSNV